jgi:hypothetical protein
MRHITVVTGALVVAVVLAISSVALGQTPQPQPGQPHQQWQQGQQGGDRGLGMAYQMVNRMIERLQQDPHDYGGYRVKAVRDLQVAAGDLQQALEYQRLHEPQPQQNP